MKNKDNNQLYIKLLLILYVTCILRIPLFAAWVVVTFIMWNSSDNWYGNWIELYFGICLFGLIMLFLLILKIFLIMLTNKDYPFPKKIKIKLFVFCLITLFQLIFCYTRYKKWTLKEYYEECRAEWEEKQKNSNKLSTSENSFNNNSNNTTEKNEKYDTVNLKRLQYWFENVSIISINELREVYRIGIEIDKNAFLKGYLVVAIATNIQDPRTIMQQVYDPFNAFPSTDFKCIYSLKEHQHRPIFSFKFYYHWEHNNYFCSYFKSFIGMVHFIQKHFPEYKKIKRT